MMWHRPSPHELPPTAEGEQSYMASAADLMIGLLFIFIIMVAFLAVQKRAEQQRAEEARLEELRGLSQYLGDPRGIVTREIGAQISKTLSNVKISESSGVISLPEDMLFDIGSSVLKPAAAERMPEATQQLAEVLRCFVANQRHGRVCGNNPLGHEIDTIFIEGHTDSRPMNREGGNTKLSLDRAISVNNALIQGSVLSNYRNQQGQPIFSYSAYAESRPLIANDPTDGRNRRVDLRIVLTYKPPKGNAVLDELSKSLGKP